MKRFFLKISYFLFFLIIILSLYFRLKPIFLQNIPYTYDQGRDFLKAQEIILFKNPTFIGPTTGIMGIYHGAWWYYFLSFAFIIFNGLPQGFAYTNTIFHFISGILFSIFLRKEFGNWTALFFLFIFGFSAYFIFISTFVINSGFAIPFLFLLLYSLYRYLKKKTPLYLFFIFLSAGFIFEAQVSFGLLLIPALTFSLLIFTERKRLFQLKSVFYGFMGLGLAFFPRILFEVKNNFVQTKTFLNFLLNPNYHNPKTLIEAFFERTNLFFDFYNRIFNTKIAAIIFFGVSGFILLLYFKKLKRYQQVFIKLIISLILFIFIFSLFYRDNFWPNYLEGFSVFYLIFITLAFNLILITKKRALFLLVLLALGTIFFVSLSQVFKEIKTKNNKIEGLAKHQKTLSRLFKENNLQNFCLRIYTPPVIPYTYQYLIDYYNRTKKIPKPTTNFLQNKCWYIIEADQYQFRIENWRNDNIPPQAKKRKEILIFSDISLELWEIN